MGTIRYHTANCVLETGEPPPAPLTARPLLLVREALEPSSSQPKLLDRLRLALRSRHYSRRTEKTYLMWVRRFIFFHDGRHSAEMAEPEINAFLTYLVVEKRVSASTQNQALSVPLSTYPRPRSWRVGRSHPCEEAQASACCDEPRGGESRPGQLDRRQVAHGRPLVWF